ncbi:MAG: hypothetical protein ACLP3R_00685 [Candidatus Korobacteraceae bacterium]
MEQRETLASNDLRHKIGAVCIQTTKGEPSANLDENAKPKHRNHAGPIPNPSFR